MRDDRSPLPPGEGTADREGAAKAPPTPGSAPPTAGAAPSASTSSSAAASTRPAAAIAAPGTAPSATTAPATAAGASAPSAPDPWTIRRVVTWTTQHFEKKSVDAPRLTAEVLLTHVLKCDRVRLYVDLDRPLAKEELATFRALIERRIQGEPTAYLVGSKEFYGRKFKVDARVLVPRPETELLVEAILRNVPKDAPARLLDLCTGSGCIAVSFAAERPQVSVWATDLSKDACDVARENAEALGVGARVTIKEGDLYAPLPPDVKFDAIASNPPYIPSGEIPGLMIEVRKEPHLALDGGPDGLVLIRRIVEGARARLKAGGALAMEITEHQGKAVSDLLVAAGFEDVRVEKDLARLDRLVVAKAPAAD